MKLELTEKQKTVLEALRKRNLSLIAAQTERCWESGDCWYLDTRLRCPKKLRHEFDVANREVIANREAAGVSHA